MTTPAGWHRDPTPDSAEPRLRYWDGQSWTEHTAPMPAAQPAQTAQPAAYGQVGGKQTHLADGAVLSNWWPRVGATLIDFVIQVPILAVLFIPFYGRVIDVYSDYFHDVEDASRTGASPPSSAHLQAELLPTLAVMTVVSLVFSLVWTYAWLRWKQGTPGKLAVGLRIRQREAAGPLPSTVILRHWVGQYGVTVLSIIPIVGGFLGFYSLLDVLWAAWDDKRQTLHDKIAGTNVIRVR